MRRDVKFHIFEVEVATKYGILEAILLEYFKRWTDHNRAEGINFHDGKYWSFNSIKAFCKLYPYVSEKTIRKALKHLEHEGLIVTGNFNKLPYDRTRWYALAGTEETPQPLENTDLVKRANGFGRNGQMDSEETTEPIPINTSLEDTVNISSSLRSEDIEIPPKPTKKKRAKKGDLHSDPSLRPTRDEVRAYVEEKGYKLDADTFFSYFEAGEWQDGHGNSVRSWKQKMVTWETNGWGQRKVPAEAKTSQLSEMTDEDARMMEAAFTTL